MGSTRISSERLLQIVLAGMMILATMLFGTGHRAPWLIWCVTGLAIAAIYLADVTVRFRLSHAWANLLAVTAVAVWLTEALILPAEMQPVAVTYLLLTLQAILWFQPKQERIYWQLIVLSTTQVAVASANAPGMMFGVLLAAYMVLGILALALLTMHRELARFQACAHTSATTCAQPSSTAFLAPSSTVLLALSGAPSNALSSAPAARPAWQFSGGRTELPEASFRRTLARQTAAAALATLLIAGLVFLLFPRTDRELEALRNDAYHDDTRSVGFSEDVTLGEEAGEATQSTDMVMRVQLFEEPGGLPIQLNDEPLFRGSVATEYSHGKWRQKRSMSIRPLEPVRLEHYVRQHITIEKQDTDKIFSIVPAFRVNDDERLRVEDSSDEIVRPRSVRSQRMEFDLATTGIIERRQAEILPCYRVIRDRDVRLLQMPTGDFGTQDPLAGLRALAERIKRQARLAEDDRIGLARALARYLRESGQFQYTLEGEKRNRALDPIEDFVVEHPRGHCEYFAGALALMLRSQGIPARIAIGFRAGEWNSQGNYYQVRQLHAHTWVEALLEPEHYAQEDLGSTMRCGARGWLVLDPTPVLGGGGGDGESNGGLWRRVSMYLDYLQVLWIKYISDFDAPWQQKAIYEPLGRLVGTLRQHGPNLGSWRGWFSSAVGCAVQGWNWYRRHFFAWQGVLSTLTVLLAAAGAYRSAGPIARRWQARPRRRPLGRARPSQHEMLCRLERALARRGLVRLAGQTPYEFAVSAGGDLTTNLEHVSLAAIPREVVEAFYRVRFRARPLDNVEAGSIENALRTLEQTLEPGVAAGSVWLRRVPRRGLL